LSPFFLQRFLPVVLEAFSFGVFLLTASRSTALTDSLLKPTLPPVYSPSLNRKRRTSFLPLKHQFLFCPYLPPNVDPRCTRCPPALGQISRCPFPLMVKGRCSRFHGDLAGSALERSRLLATCLPSFYSPISSPNPALCDSPPRLRHCASLLVP